MVHFPGFAPSRLWIQRVVPRFYRGGFPHSEIPGSMPACGSPGLIAACHVLHRLLLPRHPPCALSSLTIKFTRRSQAQRAAGGFAADSQTPTRDYRANPRPLDLLLAPPLWPRPPKDGSQRRHTSRSFRHSKNLLSLVDCPIDSVVKHRPVPAWAGKSSIAAQGSSSVWLMINIEQPSLATRRSPHAAGFLVELAGIEPATPCVQGRCSPS
jgi:hypothetical protein